MNVKIRQHIERTIARRVILDAIQAGYALNIDNGKNNGDDFELPAPSTNLQEILAAMFQTDDERLYFFKDDKRCGRVWFGYGNDGWDVVCDYPMNLEPVMEAANKLATKLADKYARLNPQETNMNALQEFTAAYIEAALWSSIDDQDEPFDKNYGPEDLADETKAKMDQDCKDFLEANRDLIEQGPDHPEYTLYERAGHDFWLTRCGHGSGFYDGDWPVVGDQLTEACKAFGECTLYTGDDGKVYLM